MAEEGLTVALTPIQLAAILSEEHVTAREIFTNRAWGGPEARWGAAELAGSVALILAPEPTMMTKVGGGVLLMHGSDTVAASARQILMGRPTPTFTQAGTTAAARRLGATDNRAEQVGLVVDMAVPLIFATYAAAVRVGVIRGGRISLLEHEATGGHTLREHVGRTEEQLRARLAEFPNLPGAATFKTVSEAETIISRVLRERADEIRNWAGVATPDW